MSVTRGTDRCDSGYAQAAPKRKQQETLGHYGWPITQVNVISDGPHPPMASSRLEPFFRRREGSPMQPHTIIDDTPKHRKNAAPEPEPRSGERMHPGRKSGESGRRRNQVPEGRKRPFRILHASTVEERPFKGRVERMKPLRGFSPVLSRGIGKGLTSNRANAASEPLSS